MESKNKKNIVLLTTWFTPLESVAVNRMSAFANYLDYSKYNLDIITVGNENTSEFANEGDYNVHRIYSKDFLAVKFKSSDSKIKHKAKVAIRKIVLTFQGDEHKKWIKKAINKLNDINQSKGVDIIISSFSPAAPHIVALEFCKKNSVKWIVDMRDEMSLNPQNSPAQTKFYKKIESEINQFACALTSVSEPIVNYFKEVLPDLKQYIEIRNGFDHNIQLGDYKFNETLTFLHAGSFYGTRKPDTFLQALSELKNSNKLPAQWKFMCAGAARNFNIPSNLANHIFIISRVSQEESLNMMRKADINVLIQPPTGRHGVYTGKIFDYLSVGKPILGIVDTTDVAASLIHELNTGEVAAFYDVETIKILILKMVEDFNKKVKPEVKLEEIQKLHRKFQVQKLNLLLDEISNAD